MSEKDRRKAIGTGAYAGQSGIGAAAGTLVAARYAAWVPDVTAPEVAAVAAFVTALVALLVKIIRDRLDVATRLPPVALLFLLLLVVACQTFSRQGYSALASVELEQQEVSADRCVALAQGAAALREGDDKLWKGPFGTGQAMESVAVKFDRQALVCQLLLESDDEVSKQRALLAWKKLWRVGLESMGDGS